MLPYSLDITTLLFYNYLYHATEDRILTKIDLAYIAGIVDGEGYVGIKKAALRKDCHHPGYHARIQIRMVDEPAIHFIASILGGNYYSEKPHAEKGKPLFCYQASDLRASEILQTLLPFLQVKRNQALNVLEFRKLQSQGRQHRTKILGYRNFPNNHGTPRQVPNLAFSDEYVQKCEAFYLRAKELNS